MLPANKADVVGDRIDDQMTWGDIAVHNVPTATVVKRRECALQNPSQMVPLNAAGVMVAETNASEVQSEAIP